MAHIHDQGMRYLRELALKRQRQSLHQTELLKTPAQRLREEARAKRIKVKKGSE